MSPAKQAHSLLSEPPGKLRYNVSAMEIVEMSGKFKLCFLEYHGIFFPNILYASIEFMDMQIQRVDCIFFSPNIKFLENMQYHIQFQVKFTGFWFVFALTCHVTYCR